MSKFARRTDSNHAAILAAMRRCGAWVIDTSRVGGGFPDAVVSHHGTISFVEIKDGSRSPSRRKLTLAEQLFHEAAAYHGTPVAIVTNETEALALLGAREAA
jgi:hypothetical protein